MKFWVGVTDNLWFDFLSRANVDEVNFWQPSSRAPFIGLEPGSPFLFKLKRPFNHVAGGGTFIKFSTFPLSLAWEVFGIKNGASSQSDFEGMIRNLMSNPNERDPEIGCTVITTPFFWPQELWIQNPIGWAGNIVRGRYYDTENNDGAVLWSSVIETSNSFNLHEETAQVQEPISRYGDPSLIRPRLGQGAFRVVVTDAYQRRCAITGESTLPVLEAAHILPYAENGPHDVCNGMLLRSDFHKLFDIGLVTVTPDLHVEISSRIKEEWFNGQVYYNLHGRPLANLPSSQSNYPSSNFLSWHNENRFQG